MTDKIKVMVELELDGRIFLANRHRIIGQVDDSLTLVVKQLAKAFAIQADLEGMKALNTMRTDIGESIAYGEDAFLEKAAELNTIVKEMEAAE